MNGLGIPVSSCLLEKNATKEVLQLIKIAHNRNIPIYYPTDLWCLNSNNNEQLEIFDSAELLSEDPWIRPTSFDLTEEFSVGATQLGQILNKASHNSCDVILVGVQHARQ